MSKKVDHEAIKNLKKKELIEQVRNLKRGTNPNYSSVVRKKDTLFEGSEELEQALQRVEYLQHRNKLLAIKINGLEAQLHLDLRRRIKRFIYITVFTILFFIFLKWVF